MDMTNEILIGLTGLFTTIVSGWSSWFLTRRKYHSEVNHQVITNMQESLDFYKKLSDDNMARLESLIKKNAELEKEISDLKDRLLNLTMYLCKDMNCAYRRPYSKEQEEEQ